MTVRRGLAALALLPLALAGCSSGGTTGGGTGGATGSGTGGGSSTSAAKTAYELCDKPGEIDKQAFLAVKNEPTKDTAHIDGSVSIPALAGGTADSGSATSGPTGTGSASGASTTSASAGSGSASGASSTGTSAPTGVSIVGALDSRDPANPKVKLTMGGPNEAVGVELIMIDKTMYMSMGQLTGGKYVKITMEDLAKQVGVDIDQLTDPTAQVARAKDAIVKVTCVGREDVSGTQAAHLKITMDSAKTLELATGKATTGASGTAATSGTTGPASTSGAASLPSGVPATMDTEMWVTSDNRPVKVVSGTDEAKMTMTYSKWGEPVTIETPPSASVTALPGLDGSASKSGSTTTSPSTGS